MPGAAQLQFEQASTLHGRIEKVKAPWTGVPEIVGRIEQLRAVYNAQPFRPFVIHLADGREIPVRHREFILTVPSGRTVACTELKADWVVVDRVEAELVGSR